MFCPAKGTAKIKRCFVSPKLFQKKVEIIFQLPVFRRIISSVSTVEPTVTLTMYCPAAWCFRLIGLFWDWTTAVSYTHLTLPTMDSV